MLPRPLLIGRTQNQARMSLERITVYAQVHCRRIIQGTFKKGGQKSEYKRFGVWGTMGKPSEAVIQYCNEPKQTLTISVVSLTHVPLPTPSCKSS